MPNNITDFEPTTIRYIFTDIDDTLTHQGKLYPEPYEALWKLKSAGFKIIPVTGRPAGWCEMILRFWPVEAVIGENGGFYFKFDKNKKVKRHFFNTAEEREANIGKLIKIREEVLNKVPGAAVASDQFTRLMDLAIDFCEDVPPLSKDEVQTIVKVFEKHGAQAKVSSIHVNGWFGSYNKVQMIERYCKEELDTSLEDLQEKALFVGDSPNDEENFEAFKYSVGVKNIERFLKDLKHPPQWITNKEGGVGFCELSDRLLKNT